jgi:hypothetical protein
MCFLNLCFGSENLINRYRYFLYRRRYFRLFRRVIYGMC